MAHDQPAQSFLSDTSGLTGQGFRLGPAGSRIETFQGRDVGGASAPGGRSDEELLALFEQFAGGGAFRAPQAFGDTEAGFRQTLDLRNRQLSEEVRTNEAAIQQAKNELRSADARHAAELKVRIRELEETLKFNYAELAENARQHDESLEFEQSALISREFGGDPLRQAFAALGLDTAGLVTAEGNALNFGNGDPASVQGGTARQAADNAALGVNTALGLDPGTIGVSREEGVTGLPSVFKAATASQQGGGAVRNLLQSAFGLGDKVSGGVNADEFTRRIEDVTPRGSLTF